MGTVIEIDKTDAYHQRQLSLAYKRGQAARSEGLSQEMANVLCVTEFGLNDDFRAQFFDGFND